MTDKVDMLVIVTAEFPEIVELKFSDPVAVIRYITSSVLS